MAKNLIFANAEKIKNSIMDSQKQEIQKLYNDWSSEIKSKAIDLAIYGKTNSDALKAQMFYNLGQSLEKQSEDVSKKIQGIITDNMYIVSDAVVKDNVEWLSKFGFSEEGLNAAFTSVPDLAVQNIITGNIYDSGWSLSKRIWGDNEETLKDIYAIVGKGMAENMPIEQITKALEGYVKPDAQLPWNFKGKDGVKIFKKQVDYNAQRLARTLVQHSYQQTFVLTTKDNPFVEKYIWRANGDRPCELCEERDGHYFTKDDLPLDHPNGMCTFEPVVDEEKMQDQLAAWFNSPEGTYPEIDDFATNFGFEKTPMVFNQTQEKWLEKLGFTPENMPKDFTEFANAMNSYGNGMKTEFLKAAGYDWSVDHPYQKMEEYYNKLQLGVLGAENPVTTQDLINQLGKGDLSVSAWKKTLTVEQKEMIKKLAADEGLNMKAWYTKYLYTGELVNGKAPDQYVDLIKAKQNGQAVPQNIQNAADNLFRFAKDAYTQEMRDNAKKFSYENEADKYYRPLLNQQWDKLTESEKYAIWEYTHNSHPINKPLSGYMNDWDRSSFLGIGNVALGYEDTWRHLSGSLEKFGKDGHVTYKEVVKNTTLAIEKTQLSESAILRRGSDNGGLAGLFDGQNGVTYEMIKPMLDNGDVQGVKALVEGQVFTNHAFTSTGASSGGGFNDNVNYDIFAPAGTNGMYVEPQSYWGYTISQREEIYDPVNQHTGNYGSSSENEVLLQRGTDYRINTIDYDGYGGWSVQMDVVGQPDYFNSGLERTDTNGTSEFTR